MSKVYHKENVSYIIKLKNMKLYVKTFKTYTEDIHDAMQFDWEKPASEKTWRELFNKDMHTIIKRTEKITNTYEEFDDD